jgi:hypothetical protein
MLESLKSLAKAVGIRRRQLGSPFEFYKNPDDVKNRGTDPFSELFYGYSGNRLIHKWGHYLPIYSRLFEPYRVKKTAVRFLEIGVSRGGSLELWRSYFGADAIIYGIDINPSCAAFNDNRTQVRIGSQADPKFLAGVVAEMGGVDIVLDDGSHIASHQRISFDTLFPLLSDGGLYVVEDVHTSYWGGTYEGGYRRAGTFIEFSKSIIDDIHRWYSGKPGHSSAVNIASIQIFDSIVAFEKKVGMEQPFNVKVGPDKGV